MTNAKTTSFKQEIIINTDSATIYRYFMDSRLHSELTGGEAVIGANVGDAFSVFDGYAHGTNLELIPNQKIVQTWRAEKDDWDEEIYSEITIELEKLNEKQTRLKFEQRNIPTHLADQFKEGWADFYWKPFSELLDEH